jgi:hypothetical protein
MMWSGTPIVSHCCHRHSRCALGKSRVSQTRANDSIDQHAARPRRAAEHCEAIAWPDFKAALSAAATVGEAFQRGLRCARHAGTYLWQACTGAAMVAAPSSHCHAGPHAALRAMDVAYLARHVKDDPAKLFCGR